MSGIVLIAPLFGVLILGLAWAASKDTVLKKDAPKLALVGIGCFLVAACVAVTQFQAVATLAIADPQTAIQLAAAQRQIEFGESAADRVVKYASAGELNAEAQSRRSEVERNQAEAEKLRAEAEKLRAESQFFGWFMGIFPFAALLLIGVLLGFALKRR